VTEDFAVLVDSLGHMAVGWLGPVGARYVLVSTDEAVRTANVIIGLQSDDWEHREAAASRIADLRGMFLDELALTFSFEHAHDDHLTDADESVREYEFA
jgi:hypothetical protein